MAIQDTTGYIRVTHTSTTGTRVYLKDLDGEPNRERGDREKVPCYVPVGGSIDILLTDRTLASLRQGDIKAFQEAGHIEAFLVRDLQTNSFEEITYDASDRPIQGVTYTTPAKLLRIEERQWNYTGDLITSELKLQYDENDEVVEQILFSFTYDPAGNKITAVQETIQ